MWSSEGLAPQSVVYQAREGEPPAFQELIQKFFKQKKQREEILIKKEKKKDKIHILDIEKKKKHIRYYLVHL